MTAGVYEMECHYAEETDGHDAVYEFALHVTNPFLAGSEVEVCGGQICVLDSSITNCTDTDEFTETVSTKIVQFYDASAGNWCSETTELITFERNTPKPSSKPTERNTPEPTSKPTETPTEGESGGFVGWVQDQSEIVLVIGGILIFCFLCLLLVLIRRICCDGSKGGSRGYACLKTTEEEEPSQTQGQFNQQQHPVEYKNRPTQGAYNPTGGKGPKNHRPPPNTDGPMPGSLPWPDRRGRDEIDDRGEGPRKERRDRSNRSNASAGSRSNRSRRRGRDGNSLPRRDEERNPMFPGRDQERDPAFPAAAALRRVAESAPSSKGEPDHPDPAEPTPPPRRQYEDRDPRRGPRSNRAATNRSNRAATADDEGWKPPTDNDLSEEGERLPGLRPRPKPTRSLRETFHEMDINDSEHVTPKDFSAYMIRNFGCTAEEAVALFHDMDDTVSDQITVDKMERWMEINKQRFPKCRTFSELANRWLRALRRTANDRSGRGREI